MMRAPFYVSEVSVCDVFVENVTARFPPDLIGKLAMVSKVYLKKCRERVGKEGGNLRVSVAALQTPDDVSWALTTLEAMRVADVPRYDKRAFFNSLAYGGSILALTEAVRIGCEMDEEATVMAAEKGSLEVLKWLYSNGCPVLEFRCLEEAAHGGHLHIIQWILSLNPQTSHEEMVEDLAREAAHGNQVHVLNWLQQNFPMTMDRSDDEVAMNAASGGGMWALRWLRKHRYDMSGVCDYAAIGGQFEVLRWARSKRLPWSYVTCNAIARHGDFETLKWAVDTGCAICLHSVLVEAIQHGHMHIVDWAIARGGQWTSKACAAAARAGRFEVLKWLRSQGCPWDYNTCNEAVRRGDLEMLMWARENECPWGVTTFSVAEECGNLQLMRWARSNGCPWQ